MMGTICLLFRNIEAVLFDLDGTIVNTNEVILRSFIETLEHVTGHTWTREALMPNWGLPLRKQLGLLLPPDIDINGTIVYYRSRYAVHHETALAEFPGMRDVLRQLRDDGIRLGVVTSKKHENARVTLDDIGYRAYFELLVAEEDTPRHKPEPDPLLFALQAMRVPAHKAIYVGDNPDDIIAAHAAGMHAIAVGWCLRPLEELRAQCPQAVIAHPDELLDLLGMPVKCTGCSAVVE